MRRSQGLRRAGLAAIAVVAALAGAWLFPRAIGPVTYTTDVADIQLRFAVAAPANRGLRVYVPLADWGLRARVFGAPLKVSAEPRRINRVGVARLVTGDRGAQVSALRDQLDGALRSAAWRGAALALAGALMGGLVALLVWHLLGVRGWRLAVAPAAAVIGVALLSGGLAAWGMATLRPERLERPRYFASGAELRRIVDQADALRRSGRKYSDRVDNAVRAVAGLLAGRRSDALAGATGGSGDRVTRVVLASDVHNNLLTLPTLRRYSRGRPTVLAGDYTINGGRVEAPLMSRLASVGDPVIAVSGNHDSPGIMRALARDGARVLDHDDGVVEFAGLSAAGFEDPLSYAKGDFPPGLRAGISFGDLEDGHARYEAAVDERWRWFEGLERRPEVLIVHQAAIGRALAERIRAADPGGAPLAILVGHTHRQRLDRYGPVTVVDGGSIGAGGLFGIGSQKVGLALLDFDADGALETVDLVEEDPSSGAARAQRVVIAAPDCDGKLVVCHDDEATPEG